MADRFPVNNSSPMQATKAPAFLSSAPVIPSDRDLEKLKRAIRQSAHEKGFSRRAIERYEAWILGFISWCMRTAPYSVSRDRIDEFRLALVKRSNCHQRDLYEAMDALAFLFGGIKETHDNLSFTDECQDGENRDTDRGAEYSSFCSSPSTLHIGWQAQT